MGLRHGENNYHPIQILAMHIQSPPMLGNLHLNESFRRSLEFLSTPSWINRIPTRHEPPCR